MKVLVVVQQSDGDVYVHGVYSNVTEEQAREILEKEFDNIDNFTFHEEETSTKFYS
jgi:uncharacterized protein YpmB